MTPTLFVEEACDLHRLQEVARLADDSAVDVLWVGDHLLYNVPLLDPLISLGILATETNRVRVGTNVLQLPLRQPLVVAKAFATLSYLTKGRVVMGVGVGGEYEPEWIGAGVNARERGRRCDEALMMLHAYWEGRQVDGRFYSAPGVPMRPEPVGRIPIWVGGRSDAAFARAARNDGFIGYMLNVERFGLIRERIMELRATQEEFDFGIQLMTRIGQSRKEAVDIACRALAKTYAADPDAFRRYVAAGPPEQIAEFAQRYVERGATHLSFYLHGPDWRQQAASLAQDVLPVIGRS
jgi:alkanesulfonate monooxygenase SsuD/methylene tetrahydromethanopterin reductase-like flavin-dependent oxidoreductase (luciferase family)